MLRAMLPKLCSLHRSLTISMLRALQLKLRPCIGVQPLDEQLKLLQLQLHMCVGVLTTAMLSALQLVGCLCITV